jgi:hypothetical protein
MVTSNEESIMIKYDVLVTGYDVRYHESFVLFSTSKLEAMKKGIAIARKCDNVSGELRATARIVREESFTPGICV